MSDQDEFMGGGFKTFPFDNIGDMVQGFVVEPPTKVQQRDMATGEPKVWGDGKPQWMFQVTLQTELRDPNDPYDDGRRTLYLSWKRLEAVRAAIRREGAQTIEVGGQLALRFDAYGPETKRGYNPPKIGWTAWYKKPVAQADPTFMDSSPGSAAPPMADPWAASGTTSTSGSVTPAPATINVGSASPVLDSMRRLAESQQEAVDRLKGASGRQDDGNPPF